MIYIMRHGKTDWNAKHKLQGRTDIPLNEDGRHMAEAANKEYGDVHFDICYCSPLLRAKETAEIVLRGHDVPIVVDERLTEMGFGTYEGIENSFEIPDCPINELFHHPESYRPVEKGESLEELYARTGAFIKERIEPAIAQMQDVLIVGHGAMNSSIICQMKKVPIEKFWSAGLAQCKLKELV